MLDAMSRRMVCGGGRRGRRKCRSRLVENVKKLS